MSTTIAAPAPTINGATNHKELFTALQNRLNRCRAVSKNDAGEFISGVMPYAGTDFGRGNILCPTNILLAEEITAEKLQELFSSCSSMSLADAKEAVKGFLNAASVQITLWHTDKNGQPTDQEQSKLVGCTAKLIESPYGFQLNFVRLDEIKATATKKVVVDFFAAPAEGATSV